MLYIVYYFIIGINYLILSDLFKYMLINLIYIIYIK